MIVTVLYRVEAGQKFDMDYYLKTHIPLVKESWTPTGLKGVQVLEGSGSPSGDPAHFHVIALLDFESLDAFKHSAAAKGKEVLGDIPKFTDGTPTIQFNEAVA